VQSRTRFAWITRRLRLRALAAPAALACVISLAAASPAPAAELRAGVAEVDITPANGGTTLGYVRPDIPVEGVHTRLTGRALVLDDGDTEVALLATDLAFALDKDSVVARVSDLGFSHETVLYTGTHTHSGPGELADWQLEQLALAIRRAHATRVPVRAGWGAGRVAKVNRNRSIEAHLANHGIEQFYGQGHPRDDPRGPGHPRDTTLRVLRVERVDGRPLAAWLNFPVHLTTSTPAVDVWDADLAGPATHHVREAVGGRGFVALYSNGASGDLMPRFDSYNANATMDLHGRRIARVARRAWAAAGRDLTRTMPVDVRWTRACYCGQEVEPGHRVSSEPVWGLPFIGGSEDGASIFHEPVQTEGRRLPAEAADPVHGRKIIVFPSRPVAVHETNPEFHVIRLGDRLMLGAPGEPSVEMARRFRRSVRPRMPEGVRDPFVVGLSNDYMGYLTTPEEYEMQHYEGGHTVFGTWTSILAQQTFARLSEAMAAGRPAPEPSQPAALGETGGGEPQVGSGGVRGRLIHGPPRRAERMRTVELSWWGAPDGVDRPLDQPFLSLERRARGGWRTQETDLGIAFEWREEDGRYSARLDIGRTIPLGRYRIRVFSDAYRLATDPFRIAASDELRVRGAELIRGRVIAIRAQNPPPDPETAVLSRPESPRGGRALVRVDGERLIASWRARVRAWVARAPAALDPRERVTIERLRDGARNRSRGSTRVRLGRIEPLRWPPSMGVGGGRTPGPGGEGQFPP
jgi:neutral ceramidase